MKASYFDEATGDVWAPDRSRVLWNLNDLANREAGDRERAVFWRRAWMAVLAAGVAASTWWLIRRRLAR